jgi:hypothetical protein
LESSDVNHFAGRDRDVLRIGAVDFSLGGHIRSDFAVIFVTLRVLVDGFVDPERTKFGLATSARQVAGLADCQSSNVPTRSVLGGLFTMFGWGTWIRTKIDGVRVRKPSLPSAACKRHVGTKLHKSLALCPPKSDICRQGYDLRCRHGADTARVGDGCMRAKITKRVVDGVEAKDATYLIRDIDLKGFVLVVTPAGANSYAVDYRAGSGRGSPKKRLTIGKHGSPWTPEAARIEAKRLLAEVAAGVRHQRL